MEPCVHLKTEYWSRTDVQISQLNTDACMKDLGVSILLTYPKGTQEDMDRGEQNCPSSADHERPATVGRAIAERAFELFDHCTESDSRNDVATHFARQQSPVPTAVITTAMSLTATTTIIATAALKKGVRKTRKSCSFCARRKKRCDGDGINKCR